MALVSVIIPTYNRAHLVGRAIQSVLAQTFTQFEILVIDDCSNDDTERVVSEISDDRITYIRHTENRGGSTARNTGVTASRGQFVAFLDSDDTWHPEKIAKQLDLFEKSGDEVGVIYTGFNINNSVGKTMDVHRPQARGNIFRQLLCANCVGTTSTVMIRRICIDKVGGFDETLPSCQDWDLWLRLARHFKYDFVPEPLVNYLEAPTAERITGNVSAMLEGHSSVLRKFNSDIATLSASELAAQQLNLGHIFANVGAIRISRQFLLQAIKVDPLHWKALAILIMTAFGPRLTQQFLQAMRFAKAVLDRW